MTAREILLELAKMKVPKDALVNAGGRSEDRRRKTFNFEMKERYDVLVDD